MPNYKKAKFCDTLFKPIATNEYTKKDLFFVKNLYRNQRLIDSLSESSFRGYWK